MLNVAILLSKRLCADFVGEDIILPLIYKHIGADSRGEPLRKLVCVEKAGRRGRRPLRICAKPFCYQKGYVRSSKAWFFRLFANGKTFAPSASEVKARDLRGLNYNPLIKVFCELFFKKAKIFT